MSGPLDGLHALELAEGVPGPMCGKVLADLGARVTRIESPAGDWLRNHPAYEQLNAGKEIRTLDLATEAAQARELAGSADLCIAGHRMAKLAHWGLDYPALQQAAPGLVYCHISGWGSAGPMADRAASELTVQVAAGLTRYLGTAESGPIRQGFDLVAVSTGIAAAQAALAALLWRETGGAGQYVEVSMLSTAVALMQWSTAAFSGPDRWEGRQLTSHEWPPDHGFQCADTRCLIDLRSNEEAWPNLLRDIGCHELAEDPRFTTRAGIDLHVTKLPALTAARLSQWQFADLERLVRDKYEGTIVPMLDLAQALAHPQVRHLGIIREGRIRFPMEAR